MKKILLILPLLFWLGCEEEEEKDNTSTTVYITMNMDDVECVEVGNIECDYLQLTVPFSSNGETPSVSYSEGNEPYVWNPLPFTDCIEDPESDGVYDEGDGCWHIEFTFTYTNDSVILKWENEDIDLDWETYSYVGLSNNFWNSIYKIEK